MRTLGVDFGTKRIGVALSDEDMKLAFPKEVITNDADALEKLGSIIHESDVGEVVFGDSLDFSGKENIVNMHMKEFAKKVEGAFQVKVSFEKEFLTTVEARRKTDAKKDLLANQKGRLKKKIGERVDASAAALLLQRYLDRKNNGQ
jgi:putative Holliday junction resolvase